MRAREIDPKLDLTFVALTVSLVLYAVSFFLPAVRYINVQPSRGYEVFLWSFIGPVLGSLGLLVRLHPGGFLILIALCPWLANVAYWLAVRRLRDGHRRGVVALTVLALLLGLSAFACYLVATSFPHHGRNPPDPSRFREGYWLWLAGMALPAFGCLDRGGDRSGKPKNVAPAQH